MARKGKQTKAQHDWRDLSIPSTLGKKCGKLCFFFVHESIHEVVSHLAAVYFLLEKSSFVCWISNEFQVFASPFLLGLGVHRKSRGTSFQAYLIWSFLVKRVILMNAVFGQLYAMLASTKIWITQRSALQVSSFWGYVQRKLWKENNSPTHFILIPSKALKSGNYLCGLQMAVHISCLCHFHFWYSK